MKYVSTRSAAPKLNFEDVLLTGLAVDGGLYLPEKWPKFSKNDLNRLAGLSYVDLAVEIIQPYVGNDISKSDLADLIKESYQGFLHPAIAPLRKLKKTLWLMELFHGPTLAFKDYPLQVVGRLFDYFLNKKQQRVTILGATSGDTGSAAIEACRDRGAIDIFMLHPEGRVSEVQRRQMTTWSSTNVFNIAIGGTFDDCQDIVKTLFADHSFCKSFNLSAVNSINWVRILLQSVYYFWAGLSLGSPDQKIVFSVPTGNFGNVFSGYAAYRMGLPIDKLIVASNSNDILTRFFQNNRMSISKVIPTLSPSMDIQISSNFERLLFEYYDRNGETINELMTQFRKKEAISFGQNQWKKICQLFEGHSVDDFEIKRTMNEIYEDTGELIDPHTATGIASADTWIKHRDYIVVSLATAHPAKFPEAIKMATNIHPSLPPHLEDLFDRKERFQKLPNDVNAVRQFISENLN